jgi:very-short-patch-repair endonuclease
VRITFVRFLSRGPHALTPALSRGRAGDALTPALSRGRAGEGDKENTMNSRTKIYTAKNLRKDATVPEKIIWDILRNRRFHNLKFRRQHILNGYIVDFYCHEIRLAVELDGVVHDDPDQATYDRERQNSLEKWGITFLRIKNSVIVNHRPQAIRQLEDVAANLVPQAVSLSRAAAGEGQGEGRVRRTGQPACR